jgi:hypothetical protein
MITNTGKRILAKYLIGQAPAYASYIAIGCGAKPLASNATLGDYSAQKTLDFEMFRIPISSRGFVTENGISKIVFTAELPTEERYEISEVGIFSAGSNTVAGAYDSKNVFSFSENEGWEEHTSDGTPQIYSIYTPLNGPGNNNDIYGSYDIPGDNTSTPVDLKVFHTNANNRIFNDTTRIARYERCRFLNNVVAIRGNHSNLSTETIDGKTRLKVESGSRHIHQSGAVIDFTKNSPTDELRLAFSVVNRVASSDAVPDSVRILVEFSSSDDSQVTNAQSAKFEIKLDNGTGNGQHDFSTNRYVVVKKQLQELFKTNPFTWNAINVVKIYACVIENGSPSEDFYVCLDAMRLENVSTENSLYGLTGYSVIKNTNSETIVKSQNTSNYLEFRFAVDVQ